MAAISQGCGAVGDHVRDGTAAPRLLASPSFLRAVNRADSARALLAARALLPVGLHPAKRWDAEPIV